MLVERKGLEFRIHGEAREVEGILQRPPLGDALLHRAVQRRDEIGGDGCGGDKIPP